MTDLGNLIFPSCSHYLQLRVPQSFSTNTTCQWPQSSKFPPNPLMLEIKWRRPGNNLCRCALRFLMLSFSRNRYNKNILAYGHDPGGLLVVLVLRLCVNTTEAKMEGKMDMKMIRVWGAKLKVSLQLSLSRIVCRC